MICLHTFSCFPWEGDTLRKIKTRCIQQQQQQQQQQQKQKQRKQLSQKVLI